MRIAYVARHGQECSNQDEEAITFALRELGHEVHTMGEGDGPWAHRCEPDLLLFHKWDNLDYLRRLRILCPNIKVAFWYFDLVHWDHPSTAERSKQRVQWMSKITPLVDFGFCTDGDWVAKDTSGRLHWLMQGFDERIPVRTGEERCSKCGCLVCDGVKDKILFTGGGGLTRVDWLEDMKRTYGNKFRHVAKNCHGPELVDLIAGAAIVVAPDSPVTSSYWSNRVYLTLGMGGFLLHPYSAGLAEQYGLDALQHYSNRNELHSWIEHFLKSPIERGLMALTARRQTMLHHTYKHRIKQMMEVIQG